MTENLQLQSDSSRRYNVERDYESHIFKALSHNFFLFCYEIMQHAC
jgi:hypothetical protein